MSFQGPPTRKALICRCKRCQNIVTAGIVSIPDGNTVVKCTQCGEVRQYRPSEIYEGAMPFTLIQGGKK